MLRLVAIAAVFALASACASVPVRRVGERRADDPTWLKAGGQQVRFVGSLELPAHVGIERSAFERFWAWLTGADEAHALARPFGVAVGPQGRIAVTDPGARTVRLYDPPAGRERELKDGVVAPLAAAFVGPHLVVADGESAELVAFNVETGARAQLPWRQPTFARPTGLAWDAPRRRLFVVDASQHLVHVISTDGAPLTTLGRRGEAEGEFNYPTHVAVDARGHLYVSDSMNFRVQHFDERLAFVRALGGMGDAVGDLPRAKGVTVDPAGTVWVVDGSADVVQGFDAKGELVGIFGGSGIEPGRFWLPAGLTSDAEGRLYVADTWNGRVQVFVIEPAPQPTPQAPAVGVTP
jgi:sugar lactone lactonase YvrE